MKWASLAGWCSVFELLQRTGSRNTQGGERMVSCGLGEERWGVWVDVLEEPDQGGVWARAQAYPRNLCILSSSVGLFSWDRVHRSRSFWFP
jgi:hypothetical protein